MDPNSALTEKLIHGPQGQGQNSDHKKSMVEKMSVIAEAEVPSKDYKFEQYGSVNLATEP